MRAVALQQTSPLEALAGTIWPLLLAAGAAVLASAAIIALYLVKSALGINLMPGPSPLHDLFYHWVR